MLQGNGLAKVHWIPRRVLFCVCLYGADISPSTGEGRWSLAAEEAQEETGIFSLSSRWCGGQVLSVLAAPPGHASGSA